MYIREDILCKSLSCKTNYDIETLIVEIKLKKRKRFLNGSYNPNKDQISHHLDCLNRISNNTNNFVFIGDFNVNVNESSIKEFCNLNGLKSLINEPTYFKNPEKPACIDATLSNRPTFFPIK